MITAYACKTAPRIKIKTIKQSGFQSGPETAPLAAVIAGYIAISQANFKLEVVQGGKAKLAG